MRLNLLAGGVILLCLPLLCSAQDGKMKEKKNGKVKMKGTPAWAAAHQYRNDRDVYFPDYYTFYDPSRGYIYWQNGNWVTSSSAPSFMSKVDMNRARVQIIDEDVQMHPETKFTIYRQTYPAQKVEVTVPVPDAR